MGNKVNIILFNPEIPQNTGNIIRSCYNHGAKLHLIKPMGFDIEDPKMKRASVTYVDVIDYVVYDSWDQFLEINKSPKVWYTTKFGRRNPSDIDFKSELKSDDVFIMFGAESTGIPKNILFDKYDNCLRLPMKEDFRSYNLANTVAILLYEIERQLNFANQLKYWDEDL